MTARWYTRTVSMLDDIFLAARSREECLQVVLELLALLRRLGFSINYSKMTWPKQRVTFLGIDLDTGHMTVELLYDNTLELQSMLEATLQRTKISKMPAIPSCKASLHHAMHLWWVLLPVTCVWRDCQAQLLRAPHPCYKKYEGWYSMVAWLVTHMQWLRGYTTPSYPPVQRCKFSWSMFWPILCVHPMK